MAGGITVQIGDDIEKEIYRLTASVTLASVETKAAIEKTLIKGKAIARKNIQQHVYDRPQGPNTTYKRTYDLLNSVRVGTMSRAGSVSGGQLYITRNMPNFRRVYYPIFVEYGHEAGAPYEGREYWAATVAELSAGMHLTARELARVVAKGMVR